MAFLQRALSSMTGRNMHWKAVQISNHWKSYIDTCQASLCNISSEVKDTERVLDSTNITMDVQVKEPCPVDQQRLLHVAIVGVPNAGKTTLVNQLLGKKLFAVSPKRHTTTRNIIGVFTEENIQVILMDTPGIIPYQVGRKLRASKSFLTGPQRSLMEAELVVVVIDASDKRTRCQLDHSLMQTLSKYQNIPSILLLNKVDAVRHKHSLLQITESLTKEWTQTVIRRNCPNETSSQTTDSTSFSSSISSVYTGECHGTSDEDFQEVFMVSALSGDGIEDLRDYILSCARPGQWKFSMTEHSDQSPLELVEDIIREKLFIHLHKEIPYVLTQSNVIWEKEGETQVIYQNITCKSSSQASIVIGPGGKTIQTVTDEAKIDIERLLSCTVDLTLNIRTRK